MEGGASAKALNDADLDAASGGGLLDAEAGAFGANGRRNAGTEKGVWKAPAGLEVTHDPEFETWASRS